MSKKSKRKINVGKSLDPNTVKKTVVDKKEKDKTYTIENKIRRSFSDFLKDELVNSFSQEYYEKNHKFKAKPDENTKELIAEDYNENIYRYKPVVLSDWEAEYFNSPRQMVRLQYHKYIALFFAVIMLIMSITFYRGFGPIAACVLMTLAYLNFSFRYSNVAIKGHPVPPIPFLSNFYIISDDSDDDEENENEDTEIDDDTEIIEETKREYVTPVMNINNGFASPASILTEWMNDTEKCTKKELVDNSGGLLSMNTLNLLLKDDANAWSDKKTLDIISRLTYSSPKEWKQARRSWEDGE